MNKFQPVKFRSIEDMLASLPDEQLEIVQRLRRMIGNALPEVTEQLSYNVPFYYGHTRICYIWPGAVPWGGIKDGVSMGFCRGQQLQDPQGLMQKGNRKEISTRNYLHLSELPEEASLSLLLWEAWELDEAIAKEKAAKRRR